LRLRDNGKGFDPSFAKADTGYLSSQLRGGNGLASIRKRARELGGELNIETAPGAGTIVELSIPITQ
jgi:signal transduction histidine kinase